MNPAIGWNKISRNFETLKKTIRNTLTLCAVFLVLSSVVFFVKSANGQATDNRIFIQPDGTVTPVGAPILIEGNTYTLTENIYTSIVVEKSGVTLDGNGHTLEGTFNGTMTSLWMIGSGPLIAATNGPKVPWTIGIDLSDGNVTNLTIENVKIENFSIGMYIWTQNNTIKNDIIKGNIVGILVASSQNSFTQNYIQNNTDGIFVGIGSPTNPYSNITIHSNYFINNTDQIDGCRCPASLTEINPWGINIDGNYWSDYNGTAKNGSDIGATPYWVNGTIPDAQPIMQLPYTQASDSPINSTIEVALAVSLPIIFVISFVVFTKRKKQASTLTEKTRWLLRK